MSTKEVKVSMRLSVTVTLSVDESDLRKGMEGLESGDGYDLSERLDWSVIRADVDVPTYRALCESLDAYDMYGDLEEACEKWIAGEEG